MRGKTKIIRASTVSLSIGFFRDIMIRMRENGYDMVALSSPGTHLTKLNEDDGFRTIAVPMDRHISPIHDLKSLINLIRVFLKEKPQVIHSITPKAGLLCMIAAWLTRVPIRIHTFTGLVWPTAKGMQRKILMLTDWLTCACATHIIPEGQGVMNDLQSHITKKPMRVLGYGNVMGIDLARFNPDRFCGNKDNRTFTYLFVGRIVSAKGINELIWAFSKLHKEYSDIRLWLVGDFESELDPLNYETEKEISTNRDIVTKGPLYGDDLIMAYNDADCFVMPSYREGFPNSVIEAGAMGLPQVVTDINGSREIVTDGENGLIVPSMDREALYKAMKSLYEDATLRERLSSNARRMIESRFERNFVQQCQIEFYEELLSDLNVGK